MLPEPMLRQRITRAYRTTHSTLLTNSLLILYMGKYLRISSYIRKPFLILTLQLLHSEFPYNEENLFIIVEHSRV